jgi:formate dehydrogenase subunit gamma
MSAKSTAVRDRAMDDAVAVARVREDVAIGNELVRHRRSSRWIHWSVAVTFFVCLFTGMPIWTPVFAWMAVFVGGLHVARVIHPWVGLAFVVAIAAMFFHWLSDMILLPSERDWLGPKALQYMRYQSDDQDVGKYNGGQKLYFFGVSLGAVGLVLSGLVMWFPTSFPPFVRELSFLIHDFTFVVFAVSLVGHIYLSTAAEPGTFGSMVRGTVTRQWARLHHPAWFREVTGEERRG